MTLASLNTWSYFWKDIWSTAPLKSFQKLYELACRSAFSASSISCVDISIISVLDRIAPAASVPSCPSVPPKRRQKLRSEKERKLKRRDQSSFPPFHSSLLFDSSIIAVSAACWFLPPFPLLGGRFTVVSPPAIIQWISLQNNGPTIENGHFISILQLNYRIGHFSSEVSRISHSRTSRDLTIKI